MGSGVGGVGGIVGTSGSGNYIGGRDVSRCGGEG